MIPKLYHMTYRLKVLISTTVFLLSAFSLIGQRSNSIRIEVKDSENNKFISGAVIVYQDILLGKTDSTGIFSFETRFGIIQTVKVNATGYATSVFELVAGKSLYEVTLSHLHVVMAEVEVSADFERIHNNVIATSSIGIFEIENTKGSSEFIETFQYTPGVYSSRQGGGYGDSRVTVRGFSNEDLDININGVTLKGVEAGTVFWSNWYGISDFVESVNIERGIGGQSLGSNAYGGTININTRRPDEKAIQSAGVDFSNALGPKMSVLLQTGRMKNGWAVMAGGNKVRGEGWVDGTDADAWAYYFAAHKVVAKKHSLGLRIFGAPQKHDQRSTKLSDSVFSKYGIRYNADWGYKDNEYYTSAKNFFHKPVMAIDHIYKFSGDQILKTTVSLTTGSGGATRSFGSALPYDIKGQIDFDQAIKNNQNGIDTLNLGNGNFLSGYQASHFLGNFRNKHITYAIDSKLSTRLNEKFILVTGIELRLFSTKDWAEVEDLLGADFVANGADQNLGVQGAREGDRIWFNSKSNIDSESAFAQLEYSKDKWKIFVFAALLNSGFQRTDLFALSGKNSSDRINLVSGRVRGGVSRDITKNQSVYINAGYFTRPPAMETVFISGVKPPDDLSSEKISAIEAGYNFHSNKWNAKLNLYSMDWKDKSFIAPLMDPFSNEFIYPRIKGLNAKVSGVEAEFNAKATSSLLLTAGISFGNWFWSNDVNAVIQNANGNTIDTIRVFANELKFGNTPQTQGYTRINYTGIKNTFLIVDATYSDRLFADFNVNSRTDSDYRSQAYQLPSFAVFSFHAGYTLGMIKNTLLIFNGHINNILDTEYRNEGIDIPGAKPDAVLFYGFGRTYSAGMKVIF